MVRLLVFGVVQIEIRQLVILSDLIDLKINQFNFYRSQFSLAI